MSIAAIFGLVKGAASYWREILIGLLALGLLWFRGEYHDCRAGREADKAAIRQAVIDAQERADKLSSELVDAQEAHRRELEAATNSVKEKIVHVPVTTACSASPAMRHAIDGVQQLLRPREPETRR